MRCCWATRPMRRPSASITCEINLPRAGADRKVAGIIAADDRGALYLCHSGRMGGSRPGQRKSGFREFLGRRRVAQARLARRRGDRGAGRSPRSTARGSPACSDSSSTRCAASRRASRRPHAPGSGVEPCDRRSGRRRRGDRRLVDVAHCTRSSPSAACSAAPRISSCCAASGRAAAVRAGGRRRARGARRGGGLAVARLGARRARLCGRSWWRRRRWPIPIPTPCRPCPSPSSASAGAARAPSSMDWTTLGVKTASMVMGLTTGLWVSAQVRICAIAPSFPADRGAAAAIPTPARCC